MECLTIKSTAVEKELLKLIDWLQTALLPGDYWEDAEEWEWYEVAAEMRRLLPDFLAYAKNDYAQGITPPLIKELTRWLCNVIKYAPSVDEQSQYAEFWNNLYWEASIWLQWISEYYSEAIQPTPLPEFQQETPCAAEPASTSTMYTAAEPLPGNHPLNTPKAKRVFEILAQRYGYMVQCGDKWKWCANKKAYGLFVDALSDRWKIKRNGCTNWQCFSDVIINHKELCKSALQAISRKTSFEDDPTRCNIKAVIAEVEGNM